jgi:hypothetical protein
MDLTPQDYLIILKKILIPMIIFSFALVILIAYGDKILEKA